MFLTLINLKNLMLFAAFSRCPMKMMMLMSVAVTEMARCVCVCVNVQSTQNSALSVSLVGGKIVVMHVSNGQRTALETNMDTYSDGLWHYVTVIKEGRK